MENKTEFIFENPKLPLMFVKDCLDAILKHGNDLEGLLAVWEGKLDPEEINYLFTWLDKSGLVEREDGAAKLTIPREKYVAFCEQFYPFDSIRWGADYEKMRPLSFEQKKEAVQCVYNAGFASMNLILYGLSLGHDLHQAGRVLHWLVFKGFIGPKDDPKEWKSLITEERFAALSAHDFAALDTQRADGWGIPDKIKKDALNWIRKNGAATILSLESELHISLPLAQNVMSWLDHLQYISGKETQQGLLTDAQYNEAMEELRCPLEDDKMAEISPGEKRKAVDCIRKNHFAGIHLLQHELSVSHARAEQLLQWLEGEGYAAAFGGETRKVLMTDEQYDRFIAEVSAKTC